MIRLVTPTIYQEVVQKFAVNGDMYWQVGLPGHDGLDFKAPYHSKVFAAADGVVKKINYDLNVRFGLSILLAHDEGYETLYGYLGKINVSEGDEVKQNQVIALSGDSDNRGYIHFGLYNASLERLKNSSYPNGELDPTPFLAYDKAQMISKKMIKTKRSELIGEAFLPQSVNRIKLMERSENSKGYQTVQIVLPFDTDLRGIKSILQGQFVTMVVDVEIDGGMKSNEYMKKIRVNVERSYQAGVRYFQIGKAPNLYANGMGNAWRSAGEFAAWWIDVCVPLKERFSEIRLGYPALKQGNAIAGIKFDSRQFLLESGDALEFADWVGFEFIWNSRQELQDLMKRNELKLVEKIAPSKPRMVTGYGQVDYLLTQDVDKQNYDEFENWVKENDLADYLFKIVV